MFLQRALDVVSSVDDDYPEIWNHLEIVYSDSEKVVDSTLTEVWDLCQIKSNDSASLISLLIFVEKSYLDLQRLVLVHEMDTSNQLHRTLVFPTTKVRMGDITEKNTHVRKVRNLTRIS